MLMRTGGRWLGLARTKEDGASFKDLTIGAGIAMQHARELHMMGEVGEEKVVKEEQDHAQAAATLRALMSASPGAGATDFKSGVKAGNDNELDVNGAGDGAEQAGPSETGPEISGGRGGDQAGRTPDDLPIHLRAGGFDGKGPDE